MFTFHDIEKLWNELFENISKIVKSFVFCWRDVSRPGVSWPLIMSVGDVWPEAGLRLSVEWGQWSNPFRQLPPAHYEYHTVQCSTVLCYCNIVHSKIFQWPENENNFQTWDQGPGTDVCRMWSWDLTSRVLYCVMWGYYRLLPHLATARWDSEWS